MAGRASDLVRDSRLSTRFLQGQTQHVYHKSSATSRQRHIRIEETWQREGELGNGTFGQVWLERCVAGPHDGRFRAVKAIPKDRASTANIDYGRELEAMAKFSHDRYVHCFVKSFGWYESAESIFIAMEYLQHGDLQKFLNKPFPEEQAKEIASQLVEGLSFMHANGFAHRDLKPANILVLHPEPDWWVKISDFGISKRAEEDSTAFRTLIGTRGYLAPELLFMFPPGDPGPAATTEASYTSAVDIWALGETVFRMIANGPAFADPRDLYNYVAVGRPFPEAPLKRHGVSEACCEFVELTMARSARDRLTADVASQHAWIGKQLFRGNTFDSDSLDLPSDRVLNSPSPSVQPSESSGMTGTASWSTMDPSDQATARYSRTTTPSQPPVGHSPQPSSWSSSPSSSTATAAWTNVNPSTPDDRLAAPLGVPSITYSPGTSLTDDATAKWSTSQSVTPYHTSILSPPAPPAPLPLQARPPDAPNITGLSLADPPSGAPKRSTARQLIRQVFKAVAAPGSANTASVPEIVPAPPRPAHSEPQWPVSYQPAPKGSNDSLILGPRIMVSNKVKITAPKPVEWGVEPRLIVAIDLGVAVSAVAFALALYTEGKVDTITEWPGANSYTKEKVPTVVYYNNHRKIIAWGADVSDALAPSGYPKAGVHKSEWFLLNLIREGGSPHDRPDMSLPAPPAGKSATDVAADYLSMLRQVIRASLQKSLGHTFNRKEQEILWCLSIGVMFNDASRALLRKAAIRAGLLADEGDDRLVMVSSPEATAFSCWNAGMFQELAIGREAFLVVDCGAGVVELNAFELISTKPFAIADCTATTGGACGYSMVNRNFSALLRERIRKTKLPDGSKTANKMYAKCIIDFEYRIKRDFRNNGQKWAVDVDIEPEWPELDIEEGFMVFSNEDILSCFQPAVDQIFALINPQILAVQAQNRVLQKIIVTGDFGANDYLFTQIKLRVPLQYQVGVVRPPDPATASVKGAITAAVSAFPADRNFFIQDSQPFQPGVHPENSKAMSPDGRMLSTTATTILLAKGQLIRLGQSRTIIRTMAVPADHILETNVLSPVDTIYVTDGAVPTNVSFSGVSVAGELVTDLTSSRFITTFKTVDGPSGTYYVVNYNISITRLPAGYILESSCNGEVVGRQELCW